MKSIYLMVVVLALYGDLLKRVLPPQAAVATLYILALLLLAVIAFFKHPKPVLYVKSLEETALRFLAISIIIIYFFLALISNAQKLADGFMVSLYISVPLLYLVIIGRYFSSFDLTELAATFLWLMIPINFVGIIQYTYEPSFLVSSAYSEDGGVIMRNFLGGQAGTFARYPSLFSSADRYSAMGLMQLYFIFAYLKKPRGNSGKHVLWLVFNIVGACLALTVAGARSRILIALFVAVLAFLTAANKKNLIENLAQAKSHWIVVIGIIFSVLVAFILNPTVGDQLLSAVAILPMLADTFATGDILVRLVQAMGESMLPATDSLLGSGLGTESPGGRPGEFTLRVFWLESGLIGGMVLLSCFIAFLMLLGWLTLLSYRRGEVYDVILTGTPFLLMMFAVLTGLTGIFELSTGVLIFSAVAANSIKTKAD
jgi:hypothetical protein